MNKTALPLNNLKTFSGFISSRRDELGLSQRELAKQIGVTHAVISRLENAQATDFKFTTFLGLAAALSVHPMVLIRLYESGDLAREESSLTDN
jgi:transcriptional regulator with XRE-family HTH domain